MRSKSHQTQRLVSLRPNPGSSVPDPRDLWWTRFVARVESRQHLGPATRLTLTSFLDVVSRLQPRPRPDAEDHLALLASVREVVEQQVVRAGDFDIEMVTRSLVRLIQDRSREVWQTYWFLEPCLCLGLFDEAWRVQSWHRGWFADFVSLHGRRYLNHDAASQYAGWILDRDRDGRPPPDDVTADDRAGAIIAVGLRARNDPGLFGLLIDLFYASTDSDEQWYLIRMLGRVAEEGHAGALHHLAAIAQAPDSPSSRSAAISALGLAARRGIIGALDALIHFVRTCADSEAQFQALLELATAAKQSRAALDQLTDLAEDHSQGFAADFARLFPPLRT